jgi:hypothetical protein
MLQEIKMVNVRRGNAQHHAALLVERPGETDTATKAGSGDAKVIS